MPRHRVSPLTVEPKETVNDIVREMLKTIRQQRIRKSNKISVLLMDNPLMDYDIVLNAVLYLPQLNIRSVIGPRLNPIESLALEFLAAYMSEYKEKEDGSPPEQKPNASARSQNPAEEAWEEHEHNGERWKTLGEVLNSNQAVHQGSDAGGAPGGTNDDRPTEVGGDHGAPGVSDQGLAGNVSVAEGTDGGDLQPVVPAAVSTRVPGSGGWEE